MSLPSLFFTFTFSRCMFTFTFQAQVDTMRVSKALNAIGEKLQCLSRHFFSLSLFQDACSLSLSRPKWTRCA